MQKFFTKTLLCCMASCCISGQIWAQGTTLSGSVSDADDNEPLIGVNIVVKGAIIGTVTDVNGNFNLSISQSPPLTLTISIVGYGTQELEVTESSLSDVKISLSEQALLGQEIVISASRVPENILQSPVTIESMDIIGIQQAAAPEFFDAISHIKGVTTSTGSMTFNSINTRGFATIANVRFVTLVDGIKGHAPGSSETKSVSISLWDHDHQNTMRIDLWTKEMPVEEMKKFYIDCLDGLAQSVLNATGDEYMSTEMNQLCDKFVKHLQKQNNP